MQIIIKNEHKFILVEISEEELTGIKNKYEVITDFNITKEQEDSIKGGTEFTFENGEIILGDETLYLENIRMKKMGKIVDDFQQKLDEYNSEYSRAEKDRFTDYIIAANSVLNGGHSEYITNESSKKGISVEDYARLILQKAEAYEKFYIEEKNKRDIKLAAI